MRRSELLRVVVDTNLFVSGLILRRGFPHEIVEALRHGDFTLLVSESLYLEYARVLPRPRFADPYGLTQAEVAAFLFLITTFALRVTPTGRLPVKVRDKKDEIVLASALAGKADYLVTGDDDLLALRDDPRLSQLRIVSAKVFLDLLRERPTHS